MSRAACDRLVLLSRFALVFAMSMAYNIIMELEFLPQVVVETLPYQRAVNEIWDTETQIDFKNYIGMHPMQGDTIPGTGGIRKIRWQGVGHGKRGGIRVIYYLYNEDHPIYLLYAYPKNAKSNISDSEKKAFREVAEKLKREFRRKEEHIHG